MGGGDGGVLRELARHPSLEEIHIAEIDGDVIEVAKKFFPQMAVGFSDPRVKVRGGRVCVCKAGRGWRCGACEGGGGGGVRAARWPRAFSEQSCALQRHASNPAGQVHVTDGIKFVQDAAGLLPIAPSCHPPNPLPSPKNRCT